MQQITAIEYYKTLSMTKNKGREFVHNYKSTCKNYFSKVIQVDTNNFEYIESRFNKLTKTTKFYASK